MKNGITGLGNDTFWVHGVDVRISDVPESAREVKYPNDGRYGGQGKD